MKIDVNTIFLKKFEVSAVSQRRDMKRLLFLGSKKKKKLMKISLANHQAALLITKLLYSHILFTHLTAQSSHISSLIAHTFHRSQLTHTLALTYLSSHVLSTQHTLLTMSYSLIVLLLTRSSSITKRERRECLYHVDKLFINNASRDLAVT